MYDYYIVQCPFRNSLMMYTSHMNKKTVLIVVAILIFVLISVGFFYIKSKGADGTNTKSDSSSEWVTYTGQSSGLYTFKYPKNYVLQEYPNSTTVIVYPNSGAKNQNGDHLTFSQYPKDPNSTFDIIANCESFSKTMGESPDNTIGKDYRFMYARVINLGEIKACDAGISLIQMSDVSSGRMYEFSFSFIAKNTNYSIIGYSGKESGLDTFHKIAETIQVK